MSERIGGYALLTELRPEHLGALWVGRPLDAGTADLVVVRRVKTRPPVTRKAASEIEAAAKWAAGLDHTSLVAVIGTVAGKGELGIVQARHEGEPLMGLLQSVQAGAASIEPAIALYIALGVTDALEYLHQQSDEHDMRLGGVCPASVLVCADGQVRLREAGIASVAARTVPWSNEIRRVAYRAPESMKLAAKIDARADVFSVGAVLWEMLAGSWLFDGKTRMAAQQAVRREPIVRLEAKTDGAVGKALADVVARALKREPAERYATITALAEALRGLDVEPAGQQAVGAFVDRLAGDRLRQRREAIELSKSRPVQERAATPLRQAPALPPELRSQPPPPLAGPPDDAAATDEASPASKAAPTDEASPASGARPPPAPARKGPPSRRGLPPRKGPLPPAKPRAKPRLPPPTREDEALANGDLLLLSVDGEPSHEEEADEGIDVSFSEPPPGPGAESADAADEAESAPSSRGRPDGATADEEADSAQAEARPSAPGGASPPGAASRHAGAPAPRSQDSAEVSGGDDGAAHPKDQDEAGAPRDATAQAGDADADAAGPAESAAGTPDAPAAEEPAGTSSDGEDEADATASEPEEESGSEDEPDDEDEPEGDAADGESDSGAAPAAAEAGEQDVEHAEPAEQSDDEPEGAAARPVSFEPPPPSVEDLPTAGRGRGKLLAIIGAAVVLLVIGVWALSGGSESTAPRLAASARRGAAPSGATAAAGPTVTATAGTTSSRAAAGGGSGSGDAGGAANAAASASAAASAGAAATPTAPPRRPPPPHHPRRPRVPRRPKSTFTPSDI